MKVTREDVLHIAQLARTALTDEEVDRFSGQLSNLFEHFEVLQQVDTDNVPPTTQSIELRSVMRDDIARPSLSQDEVLANAPRREDDSFRVKPVLD